MAQGDPAMRAPTRSPAGRGPFPHRRRRWRESGYNLVVLMVMFSVMSILTAKALPQWSTRIQREHEAELIFRGLQYAEAIRVFRLRFNRAPVRLQELIEVEPRAIRQLWNNPMDPEARGKPPEAIGWEPIFEGLPDAPNQQQQRQQQRQRGGDEDEDEDQDQEGEGSGFATGTFAGAGGEEGEVRVGPILGVRSKVGEESFRVFFDSESVREWRFTHDLFMPRPSASTAGTPMPPNSGDLGRPWPAGVAPPMVQPPGGAPGTNLTPNQPGAAGNAGDNPPQVGGGRSEN